MKIKLISTFAPGIEDNENWIRQRVADCSSLISLLLTVHVHFPLSNDAISGRCNLKLHKDKI